MPRLILLRHATAERAGPRMTDHERPLTRGGVREAKAAGRILAKRGETIDLVLSSDSTRTRETWAGVSEAMRQPAETRFLRSMFEAPDYLGTINDEGGEAEGILVIGHNPAMHATAVELSESLEGRDGKKLRSGFPKGAMAICDFDGEWDSLVPGRMRLVAFIEPDEE